MSSLLGAAQVSRDAPGIGFTLHQAGPFRSEVMKKTWKSLESLDPLESDDSG